MIKGTLKTDKVNYILSDKLFGDASMILRSLTIQIAHPILCNGRLVRK